MRVVLLPTISLGRLGCALLGVLMPLCVAAEELPAELAFLPSPESGVFVDVAARGGSPIVVRIDLAASRTAFSPRVARRIGGWTHGSGGGVGVRLGSRETWPFNVQDPFPESSSRARRIDTVLGRRLTFREDPRLGDDFGVLGCDFLAGFVVELDFAARAVRFFERGSAPAPAPDSTRVPLESGRGCPELVLDLDGQAVSFRFDLTTGYPVTIAGPLARTLGVETGVGELGDLVSGDPRPLGIGEVARLGVASAGLDGVPVVLPERRQRNWRGPNDAVLGAEFFTWFRVRFDFSEAMAWLTPTRVPFPTFLGGSWSAYREDGLLVASRGGALQVALVAPGSVAATRGVQPGDRLPAGTTPDDLRAALAGGEATVVMRSNDGLVWANHVIEAAPGAGEP